MATNRFSKSFDTELLGEILVRADYGKSGVPGVTFSVVVEQGPVSMFAPLDDGIPFDAVCDYVQQLKLETVVELMDSMIPDVTEVAV